jgi:hydrogenase maturation protease
MIANTMQTEGPLTTATATRTLIIGCGNLLRGDDGAGCVFVRRLLDHELPAGVRCADAGTSGMDVAFQMRGVQRVILVDACQSGSEPGTLFRLPGKEVENLPPVTGIHLHAFRWDHALAFGRWLLKQEYPQRITVFLVEAAQVEVGAALSAPVDAALNKLVGMVLDEVAEDGPGWVGA